MYSYRATRRLEPHVAAYIAGFVAGEGTVTLTRHHEGKNRRLVVSVANTERQLLEFLCDQIGAGKINGKYSVECKNRRSAFEVEFFAVTANKPGNGVTTEVVAIP